MRSVCEVKQGRRGESQRGEPEKKVHLERQIKEHQGQNSGDRGGEWSGLTGESRVQGEQSVK